MQILIKPLTMILISLLLIGCHGAYRGNVIPQHGPTMEQVYDGMEHKIVANNEYSSRQKNHSMTKVVVSTNHQPFKKISNPELTMYVFPHLAGDAEIPIPGYVTSFNAYERDHYLIQ